MTIDNAVMAFAGLLILMSLLFATLCRPAGSADGARGGQSSAGVVHGLVPGRDASRSLRIASRAFVRRRRSWMRDDIAARLCW